MEMLNAKRDRLNRLGAYYLCFDMSSGKGLYLIRHHLNHEFETVFQTTLEEIAWKMFLDI